MKKRIYKLADKERWVLIRRPARPGYVYLNGEPVKHELHYLSKNKYHESYEFLLDKVLRKTESDLKAAGIRMPEKFPKNAAKLFREYFQASI